MGSNTYEMSLRILGTRWIVNGMVYKSSMRSEAEAEPETRRREKWGRGMVELSNYDQQVKRQLDLYLQHQMLGVVFPVTRQSLLVMVNNHSW